MASLLQRALWDNQDRRYGSPEEIQHLLDLGAGFESRFGSQPSFFERLRQQEDEIYNIERTSPPVKTKPVGPRLKTPGWKKDQFLVASSGDDLTLDYFLDQGKQMGISASSGLEEVIPLLVGAMSKFPNSPNLAQTGMEYGYSLLSPWRNPLKVGYITSVAKNQGISPEEALAGITIETLQDPVAQAGDYKEDQPGLIGTILSQGENLGAQGNTTGVYGGVPQLLSLIDNIQGSSTQDLQSFFQGLGGILGLGEGDIENVKQAARDVDEDDLSRVYT